MKDPFDFLIMEACEVGPQLLNNSSGKDLPSVLRIGLKSEDISENSTPIELKGGKIHLLDYPYHVEVFREELSSILAQLEAGVLVADTKHLQAYLDFEQ